MNSLGKWDDLTLILKFYLLPAHLIHLDMRNSYEHRLVMHLWDGFLREWGSVVCGTPMKSKSAVQMRRRLCLARPGR